MLTQCKNSNIKSFIKNGYKINIESVDNDVMCEILYNEPIFSKPT
jgi:hypothetical protein